MGLLNIEAAVPGVPNSGCGIHLPVPLLEQIELDPILLNAHHSVLVEREQLINPWERAGELAHFLLAAKPGTLAADQRLGRIERSLVRCRDEDHSSGRQRDTRF